MATGAPGTNGVWQYGEDDSEATFSALLNKAASTTDTQIGADRTRLTALEARKLSGLVPIIPSGVTQSGGSASYNSTTGLVTFTGCTSVTVNGVFSSAYANYRVVIEGVNSLDQGVGMRMDNFSSTVYSWQWGRFYGTTAQVLNSTTDTKFYVTSSDGGGFSSIVEVFAPNKTTSTNVVFQSFASAGTDFAYMGSGQLATSTQYTGLSVLPNGGNTTGTIKVYGWN